MSGAMDDFRVLWYENWKQVLCVFRLALMEHLIGRTGIMWKVSLDSDCFSPPIHTRVRMEWENDGDRVDDEWGRVIEKDFGFWNDLDGGFSDLASLVELIGSCAIDAKKQMQELRRK